jgi:hypothetical protein
LNSRFTAAARRALVAPLLIAAAATLSMAGPASAHRSGCHSHHSCPSDRATYRWHGQLCLSPKNGGNRSYGHRVRYGGYTYYCHR